MDDERLRLDVNVIIPVLGPLREVNRRLFDLLKSLGASDEF
jgi:hypothetical protein